MWNRCEGMVLDVKNQLLALCCVLLTAVLCQGQTVKVFTEPLAPVHFEEAGEIIGIATDIVRAIFVEAGLEPVIEMYPWNRAYQLALASKGGFIFTINRTEEREALFKWIGPILGKDTCLYKLKGRNDIKITTLEDAKRYTTAVILGHSLTTQLIENGFREGRELVTTPSKDVQIKVFLTGRSDLITGNQYTIYQSLKSEGLLITDVEPVLLVSSSGYYLGANINADDKIIERLNTANKKIQASGMVEETVARYMH